MIWRILHRLGFHRNEITRVHITRFGRVVYETRCKICNKSSCNFD